MTTLSHRASHATNAAALALITLCLAAGSTHAAAQVGVQVSVHQPGFHGRVVIGDQPPPAVIYQQPVIVQQSPVAVVQQPIYMNVPPSHYQHWARHCGYWRACGQPVYFVRPEVVYRDNGRHRGWREERREDRREWREERRDERHDDRRDDRGGDRHHGHGRD
jgi:hypothetical protein